MSVAEELERLQALRDKGTLTEAEFARAKAQALGDAPSPAHGASSLHRLGRSVGDRVLGGVCGGLGAHTGLPSWAWRVFFSVALFYFGVGLLVYLLLWIFMPEEAQPG